MRHFNTGGPCNPKRHYMLPATDRLDMPAIRRLIRNESYFVLHAPRQTGKTTAMLELAKQLTASGDYTAAVVSMETGAAFPDDVGAAETAILADWSFALEQQLPAELLPPSWETKPMGSQIAAALSLWAKTSPRPLVLLLDEIDALQNDLLISVLRQLRSGHKWRPTGFPAAMALIGLRDVRDYKIMSGGSERLGTASPFNIAVQSFTLRNFDLQEVQTLLQQHTQESGQHFEEDAIQNVFRLSAGQPWLVNALAKVVVEELLPDSTLPITQSHIEQAKDLLIRRRQTHLDQLTDKLQLPRVRRVIEPILAGSTLENVPEDDREYVLDLGLVRRDPTGGLVIANPIYQEIIPRMLAGGTQDSLPSIQPTWLTPQGKLDPQQLLAAFLAFWRQHGQPLLRSAAYHEIAPHLVMMAFLDRVANGGGMLVREYAIGSDKMDLYLRYGDVRMAFELKVWRAERPDPLAEGLRQLDAYLAGLGLESGWLVLFDQRPGLPDISQRTTSERLQTPGGRTVIVIRA